MKSSRENKRQQVDERERAPLQTPHHHTKVQRVAAAGNMLLEDSMQKLDGREFHIELTVRG